MEDILQKESEEDGVDMAVDSALSFARYCCKGKDATFRRQIPFVAAFRRLTGCRRRREGEVRNWGGKCI